HLGGRTGGVGHAGGAAPDRPARQHENTERNGRPPACHTPQPLSNAKNRLKSSPERRTIPSVATWSSSILVTGSSMPNSSPSRRGFLRTGLAAGTILSL